MYVFPPVATEIVLPLTGPALDEPLLADCVHKTGSLRNDPDDDE
jgi:hypothetical protein